MMTIEDLSRMFNVSEKQIKKRYREIGGVVKKESEFIIPDGTRYPARKLGHIDSQEEKLYAILRATSLYRYIDALMLHIPEQSFNLLIDFLLKQHWIQPNGINNPYGANRFDVTAEGSQALRRRRNDSIAYISSVISRSAGEFTGSLINQLNT